jgi:hypothetical protein
MAQIFSIPLGAILLSLFYSLNLNDYSDSTYLKALFRIERSINNDQVLYFVRLDENSELNKDKPIEIYWLHKEIEKIKPVNWIKKKFGYGVNILDQNKKELTFQFVSYDKLDFKLKKNKSGQYRVFACFNHREVELSRIFIHIDGGTFWKPAIPSVEIYGRNPATDKTILKIITP